MSDTATLGQIQKILTFFDGIPSAEVQKIIESGFLSGVIRNGHLGSSAKEREVKRLEGIWRVIGKLTNYRGISITVPHIPYYYAEKDAVYKFQLRCWQGPHGYTNGTEGHVDSGSAVGQLLFETRILKRLDECSCCWPVQLDHVGLNVSGDSENEWVMGDKGNYDILTYHPREKL